MTVHHLPPKVQQRRDARAARAAHREPLVVAWRDWQRAQRLAPSTVDRRIEVIERFAEEMGVSGVSACRAQIIEWLDRHHEDWCAETAALYHAHLASWFKWLVINGHRADSPMVGLPRPRRVIGDPRPISTAALRRLLSTPMHHRTRVMIWLAALAGLRVSEIAAVKADDLDLDRRVLKVKGKGRKTAEIPLHNLLIATVPTMPRTGWWFPNEDDPSRHIRSTSVSGTISRVMRRAGISGSPHALRHWYGTELLAKGYDLRTVQELLRHSSIATTQIYTKVPGQRQHEAIAALDPFGMQRGPLDGA